VPLAEQLPPAGEAPTPNPPGVGVFEQGLRLPPTHELQSLEQIAADPSLQVGATALQLQPLHLRVSAMPCKNVCLSPKPAGHATSPD
jgi:hypothetical protein